LVRSGDCRVLRGQSCLSNCSQAGGDFRTDQRLFVERSRGHLAKLWRAFRHAFHKHYFSGISCGLGQVESDGNPIARTYWRWQWSWSPFEIYRPASSAVGMFQITDGTFAQARKYCVRNHTVRIEGAWNDPSSCWFNSLYARTLPSHAAEMTAAYLHKSVVDILAARGAAKVSLSQKQKLAAVIHLCGSKRGESFAARGFRVIAGELCGSHSLQRYLIRLDEMKKRFANLARS
jgi:hypothetical protein